MRYPLPREVVEPLGIVRYGFHGIAHASLVDVLAATQNTASRDVDAVTLQLGAGCSVCAIRAGRSIETSMGFSPLGGLPMATRPGDLDPGVVLELLRSGRSHAEVEELLTRRSGLKGMAGSADLRDILQAESRGDEDARLAVEMLVHRIVCLVGAYLTLLDGHGAIVFGGGIGRHSDELRRRVAARLGAWNVELDPTRNADGSPGLISTPSSRPVHVFDTDEETAIARSAVHLLGPSEGENLSLIHI